MNLSVQRSQLATALGAMGRIVSTRGTMPILSHVLLQADNDTLTISGTDLDAYAVHTMKADVQDSGATAFPLAALAAYVDKSQTDEPINIIQNGRATVQWGGSKFYLPFAPDTDFPQPPVRPTEQEFALPQTLLKTALQMTLFATGEGDGATSGVLFDIRDSKLVVAATDTHRLAKWEATLDCPLTNSIQVVVPGAFLTALERLLRFDHSIVQVYLGPDQIQFVVPGLDESQARLSTRVLNRQFPNYQRVIPKTYERTVTCGWVALRDAMRRTSIVARHNSQKTILRITENRIEISAESLDSSTSHEEIDAETTGDGITIGLNAAYLLDLLSLAQEPEITIKLNKPLNPVGITVGDEFTYVLMPMSAG